VARAPGPGQRRGGGRYRGRGGRGGLPAHDLGPHARVRHRAVDAGGGRGVGAGQAYPNWQLCLADDASTAPETLATPWSRWSRDRGRELTAGGAFGHLGGDQRRPFGLATGEYVTFLDHDDILKPHALAQVVSWLNADPTLDLLYSDEDKLTPRAGSPRRAGSLTGPPTCCCARTTSAISSCSGVR
jgi:hypothetical protein